MIDALWIIMFAKFGFFGLINLFLAIGIGPWFLMKISDNSKHKKAIVKNETLPIDGIILSILVVFFLLDLLFNGMVNPIYILCAGSLLSYYLEKKDENRLY
ncbi:MAG: hypothetical protein JEY91_12025 [Spirochaetaceae bacterium]|nr:hypothetical protein [Spirochaetaceae bacterium]